VRFLENTAFILSASLALVSTCVLAEEDSESSAETPQEKLQDMSDPLAVYTRLGAGATNLGVNLKVGVDYDTGKDSTTAMHVLEIKGALGDALGWGDDDLRDNSIDNVRYRNFVLNKKMVVAGSVEPGPAPRDYQLPGMAGNVIQVFSACATTTTQYFHAVGLVQNQHFFPPVRNIIHM
jgi:hypothetical protein